MAGPSPIIDAIPDDQTKADLFIETPSDAIPAFQAKKEPPPETPEGIRTRVRVIASFWAIVLFFGLPIWWETTAIYRANLPLSQMNDWAEGRV